MRATRVAPAAAHALQVTLYAIFVLLPLFVSAWAFFSFVLVPTAAWGLRNTDSTPGPRWLKRPLALVSLPLKLAAGLVWLLYAWVTTVINPFALLVYEILRLCKRPARRAGLAQVAPADGGPTIDVKVQGRPTVPTSHDAPPGQGIDHIARLKGRRGSGALTESMEAFRERRNRNTRLESRRNRYTRFDSVWAALEGGKAIDDQDTTSVRPGDVRLLSANIGWWNARRRASRCLGGRSCPRRPFSAPHSSRQFKRRLGRSFILISFSMR